MSEKKPLKPLGRMYPKLSKEERMELLETERQIDKKIKERQAREASSSSEESKRYPGIKAEVVGMSPLEIMRRARDSMRLEMFVQAYAKGGEKGLREKMVEVWPETAEELLNSPSNESEQKTSNEPSATEPPSTNPTPTP